jgi:hypothetical protein
MSTNLSKNQKRRMLLEKQNDEKFLNELIKKNSINKVVKSETKETKPENTTVEEKNNLIKITRGQIISKVNQLWTDFKNYVTNHEEFKTLEDKAKLDIFRNKLGYAQFMDEFPIVSRYIVCVGQFNKKAFQRFLDKCEKTVHPPEQQRVKGYNEDQWIRRQADYVQYLWESYQKSHYSTVERNSIWEEAYKRLKGEFDDFRNMHKEIEEKVNEEKEVIKSKNARELIERVLNSNQKLDIDEEEYLIKELEKLVIKKKYSLTMKQLKDKVVETPHCYEAKGTGPENDQKITMIETVDVNRMHEIDDKYKPEELRGMIVDDTNTDELNAEYEIIEEVIV